MSIKVHFMLPCHLLVLISPLDLNTPVAKKSR